MFTNYSVVEELGFAAGTVEINADKNSLSALQRHYLKQAQRFGEKGIEKIYFSGEFPSVYFKSVSDFSPVTVQEIIDIQRKIWNQGKVPFLYVESQTEVRIYNCYETPKKDADLGAEKDLLLVRASKNVIKDLDTLSNVFSKIYIESGKFWQETKFAKRMRLDTRVDRALIKNLKSTRRRLQTQGLDLATIHDLLLRALFVLYLEDRKATDATFYHKYNSGAESFFDILDDLRATYLLFDDLEKAFNGNLSPVQDDERHVVTSQHLLEIKRCFWSDLSNEPRLFDWRIFDFEIIPIQVISEIYEDFLGKEVGEDQMAKKGAFYTPHALAEFVLNEKLPYPSNNHLEHNVRILDPTCGSGIFLVDSLNRLLDRWEFSHPGENINFEIIKQIVQNNIFGIEIEKEAIKVAAFSIYLAMLDRLNPKTLWQNTEFPFLIFDPSNPDTSKQGDNLFLMSSLETGPFSIHEYDLIVGNPPFTNKVAPDVRDYLVRHGFAKETVLAFLHRALQLCPNGDVALISTSKILFNTGKGYKKFRYYLFNKAYVDKVYNFSALRKVNQRLGGRNLFASAVRPVCVLMYSNRIPINKSDRLVYYAPTTAIKNRIIDGIAIDTADVKYLPREECQDPNTKIWKITMWGTERDFDLINKLYSSGSLGEYIKSNKKSFKYGKGFQVAKPTKPNYDIKEIPHINASKLERYYAPVSSTVKIKTTVYERLGSLASYRSPHILLKEGQSNKKFCATYMDFDCSFRNTVYGLYSSVKVDELKVITAYFNSKLAEYIMFLTSADWGVERERVNPNEFLDIPNIIKYLDANAVRDITSIVDEIIAYKKQSLAIENILYLTALEERIEEILWDGLKLLSDERVLINDLIKYRLGAFRDRHFSIAFASCTPSVSKEYATQLCQTLNNFLEPDSGLYASAGYYAVPAKVPMHIIVLCLSEAEQVNVVEEFSVADLFGLLSKIEEYTYRQAAESIYYRRFIRYYSSDVVYIVKPNEQRFWSRAMAMNDADEIILEILATQQ